MTHQCYQCGCDVLSEQYVITYNGTRYYFHAHQCLEAWFNQVLLPAQQAREEAHHKGDFVR